MNARAASHMRLSRCLLFAAALQASLTFLWAQRETLPPAEPVISPELLARPTAPIVSESRGRSVAEGTSLPLNDLIVQIVRNQMPRGGTYAANATAFAGLRAATGFDGAGLNIQPDRAEPSFCSGATYLVFLTAIEELQRQGRLTLDPETMDKLQVRSQPDGTGVWGRWNANGPGTARLFYELHLGPNFTSFAEARPGDFVKLFWNDGIGASEHGHSAVFLGLERDGSGQEYVNYWSSNQATGFGYGHKERSKIHRVLFSRLEHPAALANVRSLSARDDYLAAMLKRSSSPAEMYKMVGLPTDTQEDAAPPAAADAKPSTTRSGSAKRAAATPAASPTPAKKKGLFSR